MTAWPSRKVGRAQAAQALHRYEQGEQLQQLAKELGIHRKTLEKLFDQFLPKGARA